MQFEEWLLKKRRMNLRWFNTEVSDKRPYWKDWAEYKKRVKEFDSRVKTYEMCAEVAHELVLLGN